MLTWYFRINKNNSHEVNVVDLIHIDQLDDGSRTAEMGLKGELREKLPVVLFDEGLREKDSQCHHASMCFTSTASATGSTPTPLAHSVDPPLIPTHRHPPSSATHRMVIPPLPTTTTTDGGRIHNKRINHKKQKSVMAQVSQIMVIHEENNHGGANIYASYRISHVLVVVITISVVHAQGKAHGVEFGWALQSFSEGMTDDGYGDVVNIDISSVVIEAMQKKYTDIKMDARDMSAFQTGSFDAVIDKGTLDSLLQLMTNYRVLKDKGVYILITYGVPISRLRLLRDSCSWTIKLHVIDKLMSEGGSGHQKWELTSPIPLDDGGSSVEAALGKNPDVHYIYVCIKENSLRPSLDHETAMD
ncbi:hypothetical protein TEA_017140 [Camellia sinensis var. sinensis]|uniref:Methyltransferase type 11 domain-containing protein n=1 Tax=Camellia sinensis var. sinensis TaxID=542762 RepID=A0A4S4EPY4_CAMSN|nr:hypothetical protein TEA_017140 [Camellia sinensis var. sinensis]